LINEYGRTVSVLLNRWATALATPQFQASHITLDSLTSTLAPAAERSFQRLIQALFREELLDSSTRTYDKHGRCWLPLADRARLCFDYLLPGHMASWQLRGGITTYSDDHPPRKIQFPSELMSLLNNALKPPADAEVLRRLNEELDDSFINDTLCLAFHEQWTLRLQASMDAANNDNLLSWLKDASSINDPTLLLEQWAHSDTHGTPTTRPSLA